MIRDVILHGKYGNAEYQFDADSPEMIIRACINQIKGFEEALVENPKAFIVVENDNELSYLSVEEYEMGLGSVQRVHLVPEIEGSGFEIVAAYYGLTAATMTWTIGTVAAAIAINIAASFVIGAIIQSLAPTPDMNRERAKDDRSAIFGSVENVVGPGGAVPVVYGIYTVGSTVLVNNIDTVEVPYPVGNMGPVVTNPISTDWQWEQVYVDVP